MAKILVQSTDEGIHISREALDQAGIDPGTLCEFEALPSPRDIQRRALGYVCWKLGDALRVGQPVWEGDAWRVPLISPDELYQLGDLYLGAGGEVIPERAPTHEQILETYNAARASTAAA